MNNQKDTTNTRQEKETAPKVADVKPGDTELAEDTNALYSEYLHILHSEY
jgi:hypothetical protein